MKRILLTIMLVVPLATGVSAQVDLVTLERHMLMTALDGVHRYVLFASRDQLDPDEIATWVYGDLCRMLSGDGEVCVDGSVGETLTLAQRRVPWVVATLCPSTALCITASCRVWWSGSQAFVTDGRTIRHDEVSCHYCRLH